MQKILKDIGEMVKGTKLEGILYNKWYSLEDTIWNLYYTAAFGLLAGTSNSIAELRNGLENAVIGFTNAGLNNAELGLMINLVYAKAVDSLSKLKQGRVYGNLFCAGVQAGFVGWHYYTGTENPIETMILPALVSFPLTNYHISTVKNSLISTTGEV